MVLRPPFVGFGRTQAEGLQRQGSVREHLSECPLQSKMCPCRHGDMYKESRQPLHTRFKEAGNRKLLPTEQRSSPLHTAMRGTAFACVCVCAKYAIVLLRLPVRRLYHQHHLQSRFHPCCHTGRFPLRQQPKARIVLVATANSARDMATFAKPDRSPVLGCIFIQGIGGGGRGGVLPPEAVFVVA